MEGRSYSSAGKCVGCGSSVIMGGGCSPSSFPFYLDQLAEVKEKMGDETSYCGYKVGDASVDRVQGASVYPYPINAMGDGAIPLSPLSE